MSGIEVAGLVLGSFPIMLNCLDYYRQGFEPLEEWWNFREHFIAFVDDIEHQMMRYNENMLRLLDPVVVESDSLTALVQNGKDPRWSDGSLTHSLEQRLASEHGRFLRIIQRMEADIRDLKKLLGIREDNNVQWIGSEQQRPWDWHMKRLQISFSKSKFRKVKKLACRNQELQEILGYSERIIPIAESRRCSGPVALFERFYQHACAMHNALSRNWRCSNRTCRTHQANLCLRGETKTVGFNVLFVLENERDSLLQPRRREVTITPTKGDAALFAPTKQVSYVRQAESFTAVQETFKNMISNKQRSSLRNAFSKLQKSKELSPTPDNGEASSKGEKQAHFSTPPPTINISPGQESSMRAIPLAKSSTPSQRITDLCSSLQQDSPNPNLGILFDEFDRQFQVVKPIESSPETGAPVSASLVALPEILDAQHQTSIDIARHRRFEMAVNIASALLQIHRSPWLSGRWSKRHFLFLADGEKVYSDYPYLSQMFMLNGKDPLTTDYSLEPSPSVLEEDARDSLFAVGVIILELIFGHNIEDCSFRHSYYGSDNLPNDQTDISTARKWSQKVLGECGVEIADVVRRCLDCSFGPRPNLRNKRFKEAVYEGVIRPLADHLKIWKVDGPY